MKTNIAILTLFLLLIGDTFIAAARQNPFTKPQLTNQSEKYKNVVKLSILRIMNPLHHDLDFGYERVITGYFTVSLSMAVKKPYVPKIIKNNFNTDPKVINNSQGLPMATQSVILSPISGFGFTPELKFYTSGEKNAPRGFYLAPYFKYYRTSMKAHGKVDFYDPHKQDASLDVKMIFTEFGGGLQLGYQWVLDNDITIDWYFLGPRISKFNFDLHFEGNVNDPTYFAQAADQVKDVFSNFPGNSLTVTTTSGSLDVNAPFIFPNIRSGIAIGFVF